MGLWVRVRGLACRRLGPRWGCCRVECSVLRDGGQRRGADRVLDRRRGQPPGRERTRSAPISASGPASGSTPSRSTRASRRCSRPACSPTCARPGRATASIVTVVENSVISRIQFEGNKRVKDEQLLAGNPVEAARRAVAADRAGRRPAHRRNLSPQRPLRHPRRAEDHRPAEQPRRSGVRDQRRRQDDRQGHRVRRQPRLFGLAPARRDQDRPEQHPELPEEQRPVRSGPDRVRPRAVAPLVSEERLCGRAHRLGGRRVRSAPQRLRPHLHDRGGRPLHLRRDRHSVRRARRRSRRAAQQAALLAGRDLQRRSWSRNPSRK